MVTGQDQKIVEERKDTIYQELRHIGIQRERVLVSSFPGGRSFWIRFLYEEDLFTAKLALI